MDNIKSLKLSRKHFNIVPLGDQSDRGYWLSRTVGERLEQIEFLRRVNYGDEAAGRLQRFFEVVKRTSG